METTIFLSERNQEGSVMVEFIQDNAIVAVYVLFFILMVRMHLGHGAHGGHGGGDERPAPPSETPRSDIPARGIVEASGDRRPTQHGHPG